MRALLKKGLDVNEAQGDGTTALHWAAIKGDAEMAQMLIYAGANVRATTVWARIRRCILPPRAVTPRWWRRCSPPAPTPRRDQERHDAADDRGGRRRHQDDSTLVENGADINAKDGAKGETPLMFAAGFNRTDAVKLLLAAAPITRPRPR